MARVFLVWLVLASCIGWAVYQMKYEVQHLEDRLSKVNRQILADQEAIQVLKAEWSYLNQPAHLAEMAQRFLQLEPVQSRQMVALTTIPMRRETAPVMVAQSPNATPNATPIATPPAPAVTAALTRAPAAKPPSAAELDEEATAAPDDLPDEPAIRPDLSLLLVKGVPQ
jgi:hypothetical protein